MSFLRSTQRRLWNFSEYFGPNMQGRYNDSRGKAWAPVGAERNHLTRSPYFTLNPMENILSKSRLSAYDPELDEIRPKGKAGERSPHPEHGFLWTRAHISHAASDRLLNTEVSHKMHAKLRQVLYPWMGGINSRDSKMTHTQRELHKNTPLHRPTDEDIRGHPIFAVITVPDAFGPIYSQRYGRGMMKVTPNDVIWLNTFPARVGETVRFRQVHLLGGPSWAAIGRPLVETAWVEAEILSHFVSRPHLQMRYTVRKMEKVMIQQASLTSLRIKKVHWEKLDELVPGWEEQTAGYIPPADTGAVRIDVKAEMASFERDMDRQRERARQQQVAVKRYEHATMRS